MHTRIIDINVHLCFINTFISIQECVHWYFLQRAIDRGGGMDRDAWVLVLSCCLVVYSSVIKRMWIEACVFMYACVGKGRWEINDTKRLYIPGKCSDP